MDPQANSNPTEPDSKPTGDTSFTPETPAASADSGMKTGGESEVIQPTVSSSTESEIAPATPDSPSITPENPGSKPSEPIVSFNTPSASAPSAPEATAPTTNPVPPTAEPAVGGTKVGSGAKIGKRKRKLLAGLIVLVVLLLAGGYAFAFYLPNTPSHVYSSSLTNSGMALDKLISYSKTQTGAKYKSASVDGTVKEKSAAGSFDATISGSYGQNGNTNFQLKADVVGENITINERSVKAAGNTSPDIYVQVSGIKNYLDSAGLSDLDTLDGQWISIDHTLIDSYAATLKSTVNSSTGSSVANATTYPTAAQLNDAVAKVQTVNKQYIFTTDKSKAVLTNQKFVAKETKNGRSVDHYTVGYDKSHLEAYVKALEAALNSSQLNAWSKQANNGQNLSEALGFKDLLTSIQNAKSDYKFDLWADTKTKLISQVSFTDMNDSSSKFTIAQNYTGGTTYPFSLTTNDKVGGNPETATFNVSVDTATNKVKLDFTTNSKDSTGSTDVSGNLTIAPSNKDVTVTAPSGATPIIDVLNQFGLGFLADPSTFSSLDTSTQSLNSDFSLTQ